MIKMCNVCRTPIIDTQNEVNRCPVCSGKLKDFCKDMRPVFPSERLLIEILLNLKPNSLREKLMWVSRGRYFLDDKTIRVSNSTYRTADVEYVSKMLEENESDNNDKAFRENISRFIEANREHLRAIESEAHEFIRDAVDRYGSERVSVSFSGGKDSTVAADLILNAIPELKIKHIFADTTLEFPETVEYVDRYRKNHPEIKIYTARNNEKDFFEMCKELGIPSRNTRWCHMMFKAAPLNRLFHELYGDKKFLSFAGIRKSESSKRAKYNRIGTAISRGTASQQIFAYPIFEWIDADVWLYILSRGIDFNDAYRQGYNRVGCFCCPNTSPRPRFLTQIYMPEKAKLWSKTILDFALKVKPIMDLQKYLEIEAWKARYGGVNFGHNDDIKIEFEEKGNIYLYKLRRPYNANLINFFIPFGEIKQVEDSYRVLRVEDNAPILEIKPMQDVLSVEFIEKHRVKELQRMVSYQIRKWNACRECLKCESICDRNAIAVNHGEYKVDSSRCTHCKNCMRAKYIEGGCMMSYFLREHKIPKARQCKT